MGLLISHLSNNGTVEAFVIGQPEWRASGRDKAEAEDRLRIQLNDRIRRGELAYLEFTQPTPIAAEERDTADKDLRAWREIAAEAYRERDAEKAAEFPE